MFWIGLFSGATIGALTMAVVVGSKTTGIQ